MVCGWTYNNNTTLRYHVSVSAQTEAHHYPSDGWPGAEHPPHFAVGSISTDDRMIENTFAQMRLAIVTWFS